MKTPILALILVGLVACGDDDRNLPDAGSERDATSSDATTSLDSGPGSDAGPMQDGGATPDGGTMDAVTMDAGPRGTMCPASEMCNGVLNTGCAAGEGCFIAGNAEMSMAVCAEVGTLALGAPCTTAAECGPGLSCLGGECQALCCGGLDSDCPAGGVCRGGVNIEGIGSCLFSDDCNLLTQAGCAATEACYPLSPEGGTRCDAGGSAAEGAACVASNDCVGGSICLDDSLCHSICGVGSDSCGAEMQCSRLNGFDDVGVCVAPS